MEPATRTADLAEIETAVRRFFAAFVSGSVGAARLDELRGLFAPGAVVARTCGLEPEVYSVDDFIAPRAALLTGGTLLDFTEWPLDGRVELFGDIAHWFGGYAKDGMLDGASCAGRGMQSMQFVRTRSGWRISAVAWDDARPGIGYTEAALPVATHPR